MNNRYFDYKSQAVSSARKLLTALKNAGGDRSGMMADELTERIIVGVISLALGRLELDDAKRSEVFGHICDAANIRGREFDRGKFDRCVNITAEAFKTGNCRNDYQFFWNMLKEAMYCIEAEAEESCGVKPDASTVAYHISNAAKESVGAVGLKYSSDQLVF